MYTTTEAAERCVAAGVAALTAHDSKWFKGVDLGAFYIDSASECVLGQIFGDYNRGLRELGDISGPQHGFDVFPDDYKAEQGPQEAFWLLQGAWERMIEKLQNA